MRPSLELEDREGALPLDREHGLLDAAALALARRERLGLEPEPLGVPAEHPADVARPQPCLVAADALTDLDDHVLLVRRIALDEREGELLLEALDVGLELRRHSRQLGIVARSSEILARLPPLVRESLRRLELLESASGVRGLTVVVVDGGVGHALLRLRVGAVELVDEALDGHAVRLDAGSVPWGSTALRRATRRA